VAVLLALKDTGLLICHDHGRATWLCFGSAESPAMQLDEIEELAKGNVKDASKFFISFNMKKPEMLRSIKLSKRCRLDLDEGVVESSREKVGAIVKLIVKDRLQLVAAELEDGLIVEDLTRSTEDEIFYVWLSLGDKANKKPFMVDLEVFSPVDGGRSIRWPIKAAPLCLDHRPAFVSMMTSKRTSSRKSMIKFILNRLAEESE
jgi:hypothetical protein